ncbi:hypothetical protein BJY00DRAFT_289545 [Aspergillus carlsbadensis]|nr:hypothetical protein BJY00DRAFT_289545 [Aspergillus carlsbadensis]
MLAWHPIYLTFRWVPGTAGGADYAPLIVHAMVFCAVIGGNTRTAAQPRQSSPPARDPS